VEDHLIRWAAGHNLAVQTGTATLDGSTGSLAVFDTAHTHRFALTRRWAPDGRTALFVMLNPSTADATTDDATLRRCTSAARRTGHNALVVCNLFTAIATDPDALTGHQAPAGPLADDALTTLPPLADTVIVAWGTRHSTLHGRAAAVLSSLRDQHLTLHCLGTNRDGSPKHPVRLPETAPLIPYLGDTVPNTTATTNTTAATAALTAVRRGLLRIAYLTPDVQTARIAALADQALTLLAVADDAAAEALATRARSGPLGWRLPETDQRTLAQAEALGEDTSTWPERRAAVRVQFSYGIGGGDDVFSPAGRAQALWAGLLAHHPQAAAALAHQLRALPEPWAADLFGVTDTDEIHGPATGDVPAPEAAPFNVDCEDCEACVEHGDLCRFHRGVDDAWTYQRQLLTLLADDADARQAVADAGRDTAGLEGAAALLLALETDDTLRDLLDQRLLAQAKKTD
jgi:hypothetical protein